jgi:peptidoglycan pentaglycine glycine transferase (the first glycine)
MTDAPTAARGAEAAPDERWAEWDRFVAAHPHGGFMQSSSWIRCRARDGYEHLLIMLRDEHAQLAGGAVVGRWAYGDGQAFYYIQEGPLLPSDPELAKAVLDAVLMRLQRHRSGDAAKVSHLRIEPRREYWPAFAGEGFEAPRHADRFREPRQTRCVDLRVSAEGLLQAMKPKGRYNVRLARRHGVVVVEDTSERGLDEFLAVRNDTAHRRDLRIRSRRYFSDLLEEFGPRAHLFFAELHGRRLACALVLRFADRATYLYGGSLEEQREVMAPYLLHHEIMRRMADAGCVCYDLWGTAPPDQPAHAWATISAFKRKLGGAELAHVPTLDHVYDPAAYARFIDAESELPLQEAAA